MLEKHRKKIFTAICAFIIFTGCSHYTPTCVQNGRRFCNSGGVFTHQWYDYYERALSCMEGGCYREALSDLDNAILARPDDKRMAKTYGIGHLRDYFPHREKGLIYYLTGKYDLAKTELDLSIRYEKSAKALFYLDKVRKVLLERDVKSVSSPQIHTVNTEIWTREVPVTISGIVEDLQYVSEISVGNTPVFLEGSDTRIEFEESLFLEEGRHDIVITARNLMNGSSAYPVTVYVDRTGPVIALEKIGADKIQGYVYDESAEIFLSMNGRKVDIPKGKEAVFSVPDPGTGYLMLTARDKLGNETQAVVNMAKLSQKQSRLFAAITSDMSRISAKAESPEITIDESPDGRTVFSEILSVKGQIRSPAEIEAVFVNDIRLYDKSGYLISFNHPVSLNLGENRIIIRARDSSGKEVVRTLAVIRETPEPLKLRYRCMFRTKPFRFYTSDDPADTAASTFQYMLTQGLLARHRFQIAESFEKPPTAGRFLLSGFFHNSRNGLEAAARITDIQTGELLYTLDAYGESGKPSEAVISDLVEKFHRTFPMVRGRITRKNGAKMLVSADGDIKMKWRLVVGSDTCFAGNAGIEEKMTKGHYQIKFIYDSPGESSVGDWVVTE